MSNATKKSNKSKTVKTETMNDQIATTAMPETNEAGQEIPATVEANETPVENVETIVDDIVETKLEPIEGTIDGKSETDQPAGDISKLVTEAKESVTEAKKSGKPAKEIDPNAPPEVKKENVPNKFDYAEAQKIRSMYFDGVAQPDGTVKKFSVGELSKMYNVTPWSINAILANYTYKQEAADFNPSWTDERTKKWLIGQNAYIDKRTAKQKAKSAANKAAANVTTTPAATASAPIRIEVPADEPAQENVEAEVVTQQ